MRILGVLCTLALFFFLLAPAPGYAQENKPSQPQDDQKAKDNEKANDKARQEDRTARPDEGKRDEAPNAGRRDERQNQPEANRPQEQQQRDQRRDQEQRATENNRRSGQDMRRDQHQHPAGQQGKRIPDDQFRSHFGRQHTFHVQRTQIVNVSQPVVVFGGYSFQLIDTWPVDWGFDDDCYIDYIDGEYFLFDAFHPGIRIAVFVIG
jgi:hypothetical protein